MAKKQPTAAFVIIGNEILSGRTQDQNLNYLAINMAKAGVNMQEVRVVADVEAEIVKAVNDLRMENDYVFTSGGIGPTHDDITSQSIAKAFGVELLLNDAAAKMLQTNYTKPEDLNEARMKMAMIPDSATLIRNEISAAPGFIIENVMVMAGVPSIFKAMVDEIKSGLSGGDPTLSVSVYTNLSEGKIATGLSVIQDNNQDVDIGSYPFIRDGKLGVSLVMRGQNKDQIEAAKLEICELITSLGAEHFDE